MQKNNLRLKVQQILILVIFLLFTWNRSAVASESADPLLLFFSDNVQGETEPCG